MNTRHLYGDTRLVLCMVGLPARGKSYISSKLARYLSWRGCKTRVFNVGQARRQRIARPGSTASFFNPQNETAAEMREQIARDVFNEMLSWLTNEGQVGIFDATNSTKKRRKYLKDKIQEYMSVIPGLQLVFLETICDDLELVKKNIRENKVCLPEYSDMTVDEAERDFELRTAYYESTYFKVDKSENTPFIKYIYDETGKDVHTHMLNGYLPTRIAYFLLNMHTMRRPIYIVLHGETTESRLHVCGGDPPLNERGKEFARNLASWFKVKHPDGSMHVWCSPSTRTVQTCDPLTSCFEVYRFKALDDLDFGVCEGMPTEQIAQQIPEVYSSWQANRYQYRFPRGESFHDLADRLAPMILELERERRPVCVVCGPTVGKVLTAYYRQVERDIVPHLEVPNHAVLTVIDDEYRGLSVIEETYLDVVFNHDKDEATKTPAASSDDRSLENGETLTQPILPLVSINQFN